jgi:cytochrome bd-type quinol oxidase subunit 2
MTQEERIENATTKQAVVFIGIYSWVIIRNLGRAINKAVHKLPWLFIVVTVVISFIVIFISKARAERDNYNQKLVHATQQLDSYMSAYGNIKSK